MQVLSHQQPALDEILRRARAYFDGAWHRIPIKPRFHSLLTGPTGVGKSFLAAKAAEELDCKLVRIAVPAWMPAGAHNRAVGETVSHIAGEISANDRTILFCDEIDKIYQEDNPWMAYIRNELYDLTDGRWPAGLKADDDLDAAGAKHHLEQLTKKLKTSVFILAAGTFQSFFDHPASRRAMGFGAELQTANDGLTAAIIAERLPRELANRFNQRTINIPELQPQHYRLIAEQAEQSLPEPMRPLFKTEIDHLIGEAITTKKGVRFLEEATLEMLQKLPPGFCPEETPPPNIFDNPEMFDVGIEI